jgi:hypothetical protein
MLHNFQKGDSSTANPLLPQLPPQRLAKVGHHIPNRLGHTGSTQAALPPPPMQTPPPHAGPQPPQITEPLPC